jgi:hypothetical protein
MEQTTIERTCDANETPARDLRRRRAREIAEQIVTRSDWLAREDRFILKAVYEDGKSVTDIATLRGDNPRTLQRRVRKLVKRVLSQKFAFVAAHKSCWSPTRRRVAEACVLQGLSLRRATAILKLTHHTVRRNYEAINDLYEAAVGAHASRHSPVGSHS